MEEIEEGHKAKAVLFAVHVHFEGPAVTAYVLAQPRVLVKHQGAVERAPHDRT